MESRWDVEAEELLKNAPSALLAQQGSKGDVGAHHDEELILLPGIIRGRDEEVRREEADALADSLDAGEVDDRVELPRLGRERADLEGREVLVHAAQATERVAALRPLQLPPGGRHPHAAGGQSTRRTRARGPGQEQDGQAEHPAHPR